MSNELFTELSVEEQETVAGGNENPFSFNFANTGFFQSGQLSGVESASNALGSTTAGGNQSILINTTGTSFNGVNIPAGFLTSFFGA